MARSSNEPEFFAAGPQTEPNETPSKPVAQQSESDTTKSYDFLTTMKVPTGGFSLFWYNFMKSLNRDKQSNHEDYLVYQRYLREQELAEEGYDEIWEYAYTDYLIRRLRYLHNIGVRAIMAFCNIKSAGKTTDLLQVMSVISEYTRGAVLAIPATHNNATSTLALMAGIDTNTAITIEELSRRIDELGYYLALSKEVPKTENGLMIVSEDLNNALDVDNEYGLEKFVELLLKVLPHVDYVGLDLGNDNIRHDSIALAAARLAHVLNFCFLYGKAVPTRSFHNTVQGYNTDLGAVDLELFGGNNEVLGLTGASIPTSEKVANSIVIANLAPLEEEVDFDEHMRPAQRANAVSIQPWVGEGFNLPYDPYLDNADASGNVKPAHLDYVTDVTRMQALKIAVANLEEAARVQGISITGAPVFQAPPIPEVVHPFPSMLGKN